MAKMIMPVVAKFIKLHEDQDYGPRNIGRGPEFHRGIDLSSSSAGVNHGDPIYAVAKGKVILSGSNDGGNVITLEHDIGGKKVYTYYAHMIAVSKYKKGDTVEAGTIIGNVGNTASGSGQTSGSHLHFEIQVGSFSMADWRKQGGYPHAGNSVNPLNGWINVNVNVKTHPKGVSGSGGVVGFEKFVPPSASHPSAKYADIINEAGEKYGINPKVIAAMIQVESNWQTNLTSSAGAYGIMQIMEVTAKHVGTNPSKASLGDPRTNIMTGVKYLRKIVIDSAKVGTLTAEVTRAYNLGPYGYMEVKRIGSKSGTWHRFNSKENKAYAGKVAKAYTLLNGGTIPLHITVDGVGLSGAEALGASGDNSPLSSYEDSMEIGKQLAVTNQITRISGISPNPSNDNLPKHRNMQNPFVLRIGDSQFFIPPINIQHHKVGASFAVPTTRSRTSMLAKSGWTEGYLNITLCFADIEQINGYQVEGPDDVTYYMDGIRSLIAQYHKNPMLPIRNEYINNALGIYSVIIEDIQLSTVPNYPNMINVTIAARECATRPFTGIAELGYDLCFNYPIWRWYYQHLLIDDETKRLESTYLRPIQKHMRSDFKVRVIDETEIEQMKADLANEEGIKIREFASGKIIGKDVDAVRKINPSYLLSNFTGANIRALMSEFDLGDIVVESVSGSISKSLSRVNMMEYEEPVYQDLGGMDKVFQVSLKLTDRYQVQQLETLVRIVEEVAREYRHMFVGGFLEVHNDFINMCGVEFCMIEEIQCATTPMNGVYDAVIVLREFNPNQANHESLNGIRTDIHKVTDEWIENNGELAERTMTAHKSDRTRTVNEEYLIETLIKQMELYPDLRLPSLADANKALTKINDWRVEKGYEKVPFDEFPSAEGDVWVEPDFYFMYPTPAALFASMGLEEMGQKIESLIDTGTYDGNIQATETNLDTWSELASGAGFAELLSSFSGKRGNDKYILDEDKQGVLQAETTFIYPNKPVRVPFFKEWHSDIAMPEPSELASLMLHDQVKYDQRCRLNRFFPTYMLLFVDEGQWVEGRRLWNRHYAYHAIHEMTVTRDKNNPIDTAYIRLSNMYSTFNSDSKLKEPKDYFKYNPTAEGIPAYLKELKEAFHYTAKDLMVDARKMMDHAALEPGARIHLRMGNSSNTDRLPTVFNGQITSVNDGVDIEIFAQGDGVELAANMISGNPGDSTPGEPHNALQKYLTQRQSNYWFTVSKNLEFFDNFESLYGVEHFGWVQSRADEEVSHFWDALFKTSDEMSQETESSNAFRWVSELLEGVSWLAGVVEGFVKSAGSIWDAHQEFVFGWITGNPTFVVYDVMKNVFRGRTDLASTGVLFKNSKLNTAKSFTTKDYFQPMDGEKNITLAVANKNIWDIGTSLSLFVPEFIFAIHHHGLRSTVFFGMPHWLVKFRYHKPKDAPMNDLTKWEEEVKPFQQIHNINSSVDMILNNIKASSELLKHDQTALYSMGDSMNTKEGLTVHADKSILSDQRRRDVVDTGVLQDLFGPDSIINGVLTVASGIWNAVGGLLNTAIDTAAGAVNLLTLPVRAIDKDFPKWEPKKGEEWIAAVDKWFEYWAESGKNIAKDVAIGNVQRNFMEMYQGEMISFGNGGIKPWDLIYMNDTRKVMSGTFQAGQVTHTLSRKTGFMTIIKPDLVVTRVDNVMDRSVILKTAIRYAAFGGLTLLRLVSKTKFAQSLASGAFKRMRGTVIKTANVVDKLSTRFGGIKVLDDIRKYIDGKTNIEDKTPDANNPDKVEVEVDLTTKAGRMKQLLSKGSTALKRNLITMAIAGMAEEFFGRWWKKKTENHNVIYIHPLLKAGVPFTAGIKGALHIIPNYADGRYADIAGQAVGEQTKSTEAKGKEEANYDGNTDVSVVQQVPVTTSKDKVIANPVLSDYVTQGSVQHPISVAAHASITKKYDASNKTYGVRYTFNGLTKVRTVQTIADGKIVFKGTTKSYGFTIVVEHKGNNGKVYYASYHHLDPSGILINLGDPVPPKYILGKAKQIVGTSNSLFEFQIHIGSYTNDDSIGVGASVNPVDFMKKGGINL